LAKRRARLQRLLWLLAPRHAVVARDAPICFQTTIQGGSAPTARQPVFAPAAPEGVAAPAADDVPVPGAFEGIIASRACDGATEPAVSVSPVVLNGTEALPTVKLELRILETCLLDPAPRIH
jgi:hypothetical protein